MKNKAVISLRRLLSASLFFIAAGFILTNTFIFKGSQLASIDTILTLTWGLCWTVTAIHQLYFRAVVAVRAVKDSANQNDEIVHLRQSSHSLIKSSLITTTALSSCAMDFYRAQEPTVSTVSRVIGSVSWVSLGCYEIWLAFKNERKHENDPGKTIRLCGLKPESQYTIHATLYLLIGLVYAVGVWTDEQNSPMNADPRVSWMLPIPNICWLLAGINEFSRTLQTLTQSHLEQAPSALQQVTIQDQSTEQTTSGYKR